MRGIKFRGKRIDNSKWIYGYLAEIETDWDFYNGHGLPTEYSKVIFETNLLTRPMTIIAPETVGQYTGLNDKNGTEIYEGDRVIDEENFLWEVVFEDGCFFIENIDMPAEKIPLYTLAGLYSYRLEHFEIIGNIHDNPEILEVE